MTESLRVTKATINEMKSAGDLRENDGYTLSLEAHESNERRIGEIEAILENYEIIENADTSTVTTGNKVDVKVGNKKMTFHIVSEHEANPLEQKISEKSPIASALINKEKGETVEVETPGGVQKYKIEKIYN